MSIIDPQVHIQPSLVQNLYYFPKVKSHFEKLLQNFELKRVGGVPKGPQFVPLGTNLPFIISLCLNLKCYLEIDLAGTASSKFV